MIDTWDRNRIIIERIASAYLTVTAAAHIGYNRYKTDASGARNKIFKDIQQHTFADIKNINQGKWCNTMVSFMERQQHKSTVD